MKQRHYSWQELFIDIKEISNILRKCKFHSLILVSRGGLIPGGLLARYLDICHIEVICIKSYSKHNRKEIKVFGRPFWEDTTILLNPLIVDDICDSGETLKYITSFVKAPVFTLFYKVTQGVFTPTYYLHKTTKWVQFPWE